MHLGSMKTEGPVLTTLDVSQIVWVRKTVGRAQLTVKLGSFVVALGSLIIGVVLMWTMSVVAEVVVTTFELTSALRGLIWLGAIAVAGLPIGVGGLTLWAGFRIARGLRRGSRRAAQLLLLGIAVLSIVAAARLAAAIALQESSIQAAVLAGLWVFVAYFGVRGAFAVWRGCRAEANLQDRALFGIASPWETADRRRPPSFANTSRVQMYFVLVFVPLPLLLLVFSNLAQISESIQTNGSLRLPDGRVVGAALFAEMLLVFVLVVPATAAIYRAARRRAVRRATDPAHGPALAPILYLRSFGDDKLKVRARATDGRSWLEAAVRVSFEELISDHLFQFGPLIAIGRPEDRAAPLGAVREYLGINRWLPHVESLMQRAVAIVVVVGRTEGLAAEIARVFDRGLQGKLVLVVPPVSEQEVTARWDYVRARVPALTRMLPLGADLLATRALVMPAELGPVVIGSEDRDAWSYEVAIEAAINILFNKHSLVPAASKARLHDVPTALQDWVGRVAGDLAFGFAVGLCLIPLLTFMIGILPVSLLLFFAGDTIKADVGYMPLVGTISGAAVCWFVIARWLPSVNPRERLLVTALYGLLVAVQSVVLVPALPLLYFSVRHDQAVSARRRGVVSQNANTKFQLPQREAHGSSASMVMNVALAQGAVVRLNGAESAPPG